MLAMLKYVPGVLTKKISMQELRPLLNAEVAPYITKLSVHKMPNRAYYIPASRRSDAFL